jgi:hypothetical protein
MYKKALVISIVCFSLFLRANGNTTGGISINGYEWQKWPTGSKIAFVQGWAICGETAQGNFVINVDKWDESIKDYKVQVESFKDTGVLLSGVTIGQTIDTIDKIYSDPRVKTMDIAKVMSFVSGRLIGGWTENELDAVIAITVRLKQCEEKGENYIENCGSIRKERNSYLQKLKKQ